MPVVEPQQLHAQHFVEPVWVVVHAGRDQPFRGNAQALQEAEVLQRRLVVEPLGAHPDHDLERRLRRLFGIAARQAVRVVALAEVQRGDSATGRRSRVPLHAVVLEDLLLHGVAGAAGRRGDEQLRIPEHDPGGAPSALGEPLQRAPGAVGDGPPGAVDVGNQLADEDALAPRALVVVPAHPAAVRPDDDHRTYGAGRDGRVHVLRQEDGHGLRLVAGAPAVEVVDHGVADIPARRVVVAGRKVDVVAHRDAHGRTLERRVRQSRQGLIHGRWIDPTERLPHLRQEAPYLAELRTAVPVGVQHREQPGHDLVFRKHAVAVAVAQDPLGQRVGLDGCRRMQQRRPRQAERTCDDATELGFRRPGGHPTVPVHA